MDTEESLEFASLPLVEVVLRMSFERPIVMSFELINRFSAALGPDFPDITEIKKIEAAPGVKFELEMAELPGAVFTGGESGLLITLQKSVVAVRWLKRARGQGTGYPRFPVLKEALSRAHTVLAGMDGVDVKPCVTNMAYVNLVQEAPSASSLQRYLSAGSLMQVAADTVRMHVLEAAWQESDGVDVRFRVDARPPTVEHQAAAFTLTTVAGQRITPPAAHVDAALDVVHQRLQSFFTRLISDHAKQEWGLAENTNA